MGCATCRKLIALGATAYRCSVASCNAGRMKLRFCSVACWEKHVPTARHRKASWIAEHRGASDEAGGDELARAATDAATDAPTDAPTDAAAPTDGATDGAADAGPKASIPPR